MSQNNNIEQLNEILELMQSASDVAVQVDRNQDHRIWQDLNLLMSGDHIDFAHIKVLLPKFLTNYGKYEKITSSLIDEMTKLIDAMHDMQIKIQTKQKYPAAQLPELSTIKRKYSKLKSKWDRNLLYAMKIVNVDTQVKFDKFALLQVLNRSNGDSNWDQLSEVL